MRRRSFLGAMLANVAACAVGSSPKVPSTSAPATRNMGVIVMAHGGDEAWNRAILDAVAPMNEEMPVQVAFGMAVPDTLQDAAEKLERKGIDRIAVVRLFISGDSFKDRTEMILGLREGAPPRPANVAPRSHDGAHEHAAHDMASMPLWRVDSRARFALSSSGLMDADATGEVLAERAAALSVAPSRESVLVLGHGPGDDGENARWLARMNDLAGAIRRRLPFRDVRVETLREDWPERRKEAETRIRQYVESGHRDGGNVIVIPFRVFGFGPYAEVLQGLDYVADRKGLLPSRQIAQWIRQEAKSAALGAGWNLER